MYSFISIIIIAVSIIVFLQHKQDLDYTLHGVETLATVQIVEKSQEPINGKNRNKKLDDTYIVHYEFELEDTPIRGKDNFYSFANVPEIGSKIIVQFMKENPSQNRIKP